MMHVMEPAGRNGGGTAAGNAGTANGSAAGSTAALLTPTAAGGGLNHHHLNHHNHHHHHHHLHTHTPQLVGAGAAAAAAALPNGGKRECGELQPLKTKKPGSSSLLMLGGLNGACAEDEVDSDLAGEDDEDDDEDGDGTAGGKRARLESLSSNGGNNSPEIDIVINNVVCSFSVRCHLNLRDIALRGINVEYRRENGMVTMKLRRPYTTASIWSSGKITCTGANSEDHAKIAARRYARLLQKLGFNIRFKNFRVVNVLGSCSLPFAIKITQFSQKYKEASYEPELHPGVTFKMRDPKATLKIFSTGSITVTAPSVRNVQLAIEKIYPLVHEFQKPKTDKTPRNPGPPVHHPPNPDDEDHDDIDVAAGMASSSNSDNVGSRIYGAKKSQSHSRAGLKRKKGFSADSDDSVEEW